MAATKPAFTPPGKKGDMIFSALVKLAALIVLLMLGGIIVSLIISSWPSIQKFGFAFLWTKEWDAPNEIFGALVPIYGTLVTSFIALLIAVPVSFGIALFLTTSCRPSRSSARCLPARRLVSVFSPLASFWPS